jgi:hypothetical protein
MIIRNGVNIYPISFEASLRAMTDPSGRRLLRECALVGVWNERRQDEDVVLFIEPAAGVEPDLEYLKREAARLCGSDAKPDAVLIRRPIPVLPDGKTRWTSKPCATNAAQRYRQSQRLKRPQREYRATPQPPWDRLPGALMPFDLGGFSPQAPDSPSRPTAACGAIAGPIAFRLFFYAVGQSSWALDELLDPRWRRAEMRRPLFILGHQRSGTPSCTYCSARTRPTGRSLLLHEMCCRPIARNAPCAGSSPGQRARRRLGRIGLRRLEERKNSAPSTISIACASARVEEDEFVLWAIYASAMSSTIRR